MRLITIVALFALGLVAFQQSYAKAHESGIEQPVGFAGLAEYYFRHPGKLFISFIPTK
jgi:hypothetical protein